MDCPVIFLAPCLVVRQWHQLQLSHFRSIHTRCLHQKLWFLLIFLKLAWVLFSLFNNKYAAKQGYKSAYVTYGGIQLFVSLFAIPLYIYGKK